jgi:hypothetical protein
MRAIFKILSALLLIASISWAAPASADVNSFEFESFDASYELSVNKAADNRPEMLVTETLVALFPETDQNRGIRRDIPASSYGSLPGLVQIVSVTDEAGVEREYEETSDGDFVSLAIKASDDSFVHGRQTYVIKYKQSWVIANYQSSSGFDEFYWDVNGTGWKQPFGHVTATVNLDAALAANVVGDKASCYQGEAGDSSACESLQVTANGFSFSANELAAGENLSIALPFKPNVVNTSGPKVEGTAAWWVFVLCGPLLLLILLWAIYHRTFHIRNQGKKAFIYAQYQPAEEPGLLVSGLVAGKTVHLLQACIVELAVAKVVEIEPTSHDDKTFIVRRTSVPASDESLLKVLGLVKAGDQLTVGRYADDYANRAVSMALPKFIAERKMKLPAAGYFVKRSLGLPAMVFAGSLAVFVTWIVATFSLDAQTDAGYTIAPILSFIPFAAIYWLLLSKRALSAKGVEVVNYLSGLELYIKLAESDRLAFLQSPKGASLTESELAGKKVLKLYEDVLPWAILLGLQKEWSELLLNQYQQQDVASTLAVNALIVSNLSNFGSAVSSSLSVSDSGGSSGGGSSGGGSGGGGGGGI